MRRVLLAVALVSLAVAACGDDQGDEAATTTTTSSRTDDTVALPHANPRPSTMQLRPVLGEAADCPPRQGNPPPDQPVSMLRQNQCLSLGPSGLTVKKAAIAAMNKPDSGGLVVRVAFTEEDGKTFAKLSTDYQRDTIAIVAFGRVLATPRLYEPVTEGVVDVSGLTINEAADLKAALA